ncbi:unnamed protein product [Microthlaspi erraticum]|uniref:Uncharacterized protein n=1 Tax=Microthlaspi erraticum TaxID=1685480 RepID=A0A6D2J1C6_9BRAS|nr:unnamed protein product [Microthlaspi erraticum]
MRTRPLNYGKWDDSLHYVVGDGVSKTKVSDPASNASLRWKRTKPPPNVIPKASASCAINAAFRSCMCMSASLSLMHVHIHELASRQLQESRWRPRWFERQGESETFEYTCGYWEARGHINWDDCPDIFGEFTEELPDSA